MSEEGRFRSIYITANTWERLEKHQVECWSFHTEIDEVVEKAIKEYLERSKE